VRRGGCGSKEENKQRGFEQHRGSIVGQVSRQTCGPEVGIHFYFFFSLLCVLHAIRYNDVQRFIHRRIPVSIAIEYQLLSK
jgi:hypothetical protein